MHGEYKVVDGKLVVADLEVRDGKLADVQISGDFFLEPAEALTDITAALTGLPADASSEDIITALDQGIPTGTALVGFSVEAIAIAVRCALGVAKSWRDYEWQIIDTDPMSPAMHLAVDDVLAREVAAGRRAPTLRIWQWERPAIIIGNFQSLRNEVDLEAAERLGVQIVRRGTGGGAMFVEPGAWVLQGLKEVGIDAFYKPLNDISSPKGKIGGAAQKRYSGGTVLHHVTMSYDMDAEKMMQVLRIGREKLSDKGITFAAKRVDPVRSQTGMTREEVIARLIGTFKTLHGGTEGGISEEEMAAAATLATEKFETVEWLHHVP